MRGYFELLKASLQLMIPVMDHNGKYSHSYYTCGQDHDRRNPHWKPFRVLEEYCRRMKLDDWETREMVEELVGRRLACECELLSKQDYH
jgi:hypothetical protein